MVWIAAISAILFCYCLISFLFPNSCDLSTLGLTTIQLTQRRQAIMEIMHAATPQERQHILVRWLDVAEDLTGNRGFGVDSWYYENLATLYQEESKYTEEMQILQRFRKQPHTTHQVAQPLLIRLRTVRQLAAKRGMDRIENEIDGREGAPPAK